MEGRFTVANGTSQIVLFPGLKRRQIEANFFCCRYHQWWGFLLFRQVDRCVGLSEAEAAVLGDTR